MDSAALDRALCERLGIEPIDESPGHKYAGHDGTSDCQNGCGAWMGPYRSGAPAGVDPFGECPLAAPVYPPLSTSEAGFSILWRALKRNGWSVFLSDDGDCWARVSKTPNGEFRSGYYDTAPMALALAAAASLGIEVQP